MFARYFFESIVALAVLSLAISARAQEPPATAGQPQPGMRAEAALKGLSRREWKVGDTTREALVHVPEAAKTTLAPVIFAYHGHGGTMQRAAVMFDFHRAWPEAIV